jgi:YesN/AraC family two-component response regulator
LQLIFEKKPDAIISDVTMPQMDGITLCRKLKKNIQLAHIPVILLTARADEEATLQGLGIGADAYITKPFNIKILRQKISNLIQLRQQLRNVYQGKQLQEDKLETIEAEDYEDKLMERLMNVINNHIGDADFSVETLCEEVGISRASLHRKLKEKTNQSTSIFIRNVRLKQAEKFLLETNLHVSEIATKVGFKHTSYFINSFRELYGMSPNEWKERERSK